MYESQLHKGVTDLLVLAVLSGRESYGYDILREIRAAGIDSLSDASVYGTLKRLEDQALLESRLVASNAGPARKYYLVTTEGLAHLEEGLATLGRITAAVRRLTEEGAKP